MNEDRAFLAQPPDFQGIGLDDGLSMGFDDVLNAWQLFHVAAITPADVVQVISRRTRRAGDEPRHCKQNKVKVRFDKRDLVWLQQWIVD